MPPKTCPSERFKERRHERPPAPPANSAAPGARWRNQPSHNNFPTRLPGNGRQGPSYNSAQSDHAYTYRTNEGFHPSGSQMDAPYNRSNRGNKGPFVHKDMMGNSREGDMAPISSGRLRLGSDPRLRKENRSFGQRNLRGTSWDDDEAPSVRKNLKRCFQEPESEFGSVDWKPPKWTRSESFAPWSPNSELAPVDVVSSDVTGSRKKNRLDWGEGLVKFENKKKVEGPTYKSRRASGFFGPASATTRSSVTCSSLRGVASVNPYLRDSATVKSYSKKSTSINKLSVHKGETIKAIEEIEIEIDSLENDLNKLCSMPENDKSDDCVEVIVVENLEDFQVYNPNNGIIEDVSNLEGSEDTLRDRISASNKDTAIEANSVLEKLLSSENSRTSNDMDYVQIMKKVAFKKNCQIFEEKVSAIKYRVRQNQWKENSKAITLKKNPLKSRKGLEISSGAPCGSGDRKQRLFMRSRSSNAGGDSSLIPTAVIDFTNKLLTGSQIKRYRNFLKMPALIADKERIASQFISNNGLVEDPCAAEKERVMINSWTREEIEIFMDKFATSGKNFKTISSFLDHKTTADCVEFYYKNHKSDWFVKIKKKPDFAEQGKSSSMSNYLVGSGKKWNGERKAASLDVLSEATAAAAKSDLSTGSLGETRVSEREKEAADGLDGICGSTFDRGDSHKDLNQNEVTDDNSDGSCSDDSRGKADSADWTEEETRVGERETRTPDGLDGICGSTFDRGDSHKDLNKNVVAIDDSDGSCSDDSREEADSADWTEEEKSNFLQAFATYGKDFAMISQRVGTKSRNQCNIFFSKGEKPFGLDKVPTESDENRPVVDHEGGGGIENGVDTELAIVENPTSTLHPQIEEDDAAASVADDVAMEPSLDSWINLDDNEDTAGTRLRDLNCIDKNLNASDRDKAPNVDDVDFWGNCKQVQNININLNPPLRSLDISPIGNRSPVSSAQNYYAKTSEIFYENSRSVNTCSHVAYPSQEGLVWGSGVLESPFQYHDQNLNVSDRDKAPNVDDVDFWGNSKQIQNINVDLNPPLRSLDISLIGNRSPVSSAQNYYAKTNEMFYENSRSVNTCSHVVYPSQSGVLESPFQYHEQRKSYPSHQSRSSSDSEKSKSDGDVVLFGQILKSRPNRSVISNAPGNNNQKNSGIINQELDSSIGKFGRNNYLGHENIPTGSFGFLNENVISAFPNLQNPRGYGKLLKISDPVPAIKMQYGKVEQHCTRPTTIDLGR